MTKRKIEVFTAGCALCAETVKLVEDLACPSCEIMVLDMQDVGTAQRAKELGVRAVPAVAVEGKLLDCCRGGVEAAVLRAAGVGTPVA